MMTDAEILEENLRWVNGLPDGWADLYRHLIHDVHAIDAQLRVTQAKEKFGELRVYMEAYNKSVCTIIDEASRQSRFLCQTCGESGVLSRTNDGFYATVCPTHSSGFKPAMSPMRHLRMVVPPDQEPERGDEA
jgi:hypothetical protein